MQKLDSFIANKKIPNIIFHGPPGSGKKTILHDFIHKIYNSNKAHMDQYVMYVNCAYGKGIKFIRDDIKGFAKTNIHGQFKSIILLNAEKLTTDAQSALRRCIEQFSFNTRFFIVTENKYKLLKPILSRFSEIYISSPINLHTLAMTAYNMDSFEADRTHKFKEIIDSITADTINSTVTLLYESAYSSLDLADYIEKSSLEPLEKYTWLMYFYKIKSEFRNESLLMYVLLYLYVFRTDSPVKLFM